MTFFALFLVALPIFLLLVKVVMYVATFFLALLGMAIFACLKRLAKVSVGVFNSHQNAHF